MANAALSEDLKATTSASPSDTGTPASTVTDGNTPVPVLRPKPSQNPSLQPPTPLAPQRQPPNGHTSMSPAVVSNGPLSSTHIVPARPKPGRKTAIDEPSNKRKAQNRQAQRAFRLRKQEQAQSLEENNRSLAATVEKLEYELEQLRQGDDQRNAAQQENLELKRNNADLQRSYTELQRSFTDLQQQLRAEQDRSNNLLNAQRTFQAQAREAIGLKQQLQELQRQLTIAQHHQRATLPDGSVSLRMNPRAVAAAQTPPTITRTPPPLQSILHPPPPTQPKKQQSATGGCGDCEETGRCACIDTFIDATSTSKETGFAAAFARNNSTMSINSVLSPQQDGRARTGSQQNVPDLMSDASSTGEEIEIDFTNFKKPAPNLIDQDTPAAQQPPSALLAAEDCGFCTDDTFCACRQAELNSVGNNAATANNGKGLDLVMTNSSLATPSSLPTNRPMQPGTCPACQANPEQKAFCESLAREHATSRHNNADDSDRTAKRPRLDASHDIRIPCADAYPLYKRLSRSGSSITYDTLYKEFMQSQPNSRRGTQIDSAGGTEGNRRQYSAFEADIGEVLASLHRHGSKSSASGSGAAAAANDDELRRGGMMSTSDPPTKHLRRPSSDDMLETMPVLPIASGRAVQSPGYFGNWGFGTPQQQMQRWPGFDDPLASPFDAAKLRRGSSAPPKPGCCQHCKESSAGDTTLAAGDPSIPFGFNLQVGYPAPVKREWSGGPPLPIKGSFSPTRALDGFDFGLDLRKYSQSNPSTPLFPGAPGPVSPLASQFDFSPWMPKPP